jgi:hypothetical protein
MKTQTAKQVQAEQSWQREISAAYDRGFEAGRLDAAQRIVDAIEAPPLARVQAALWELGGSELQRDGQ